MKHTHQLLACLLLACALTACAPAVSPTALPTAEPTPSNTMTVTVYFGNSEMNPGMVDCSLVYPVQRLAPHSPDVVAAALRALLAGPTPAEAENGYVSTFSAATADALISVKVRGDTAYVNLRDLRSVIPNASTSCGSAALLAEMSQTVMAAVPVQRVLYAFEGQPELFYEWIQIGCSPENDDCNPAPFRDDVD